MKETGVGRIGGQRTIFELGEDTPFRLYEYMIRVRFEQILTRLKYIDEETPHYVDRFVHVHKLVEAWDSNMSINFIPGWISLSGESMMI